MNELVYLKNDEAMCDSLQVAEKFGKRHDKLISEIERMYSDLIGKGCARNGGDPLKLRSAQRCFWPAEERRMMGNITECI